MNTIPDIVVIGDINLDWVINQNLTIRFGDLVQNGVIVWGPIEELPGGSGLNFALCAKEEGFQPLLLGKVGADLAGQFLLRWLTTHGIITGVNMDSSLSTGRAFIIRDSHDVRLLVNSENNANRSLSITDVDTYYDIIRACHILYVSGYSIMDQNSSCTKATLRAIDLACDAHYPQWSRFIFDVVPHRIYERYTFDQFRKLTDKADILVSEVATIRRFLNFGFREEVIDLAVVEETVETLKNYYQSFILRYGRSGCDEQVLWDGETKRIKYAKTAHDEAVDKRGYGDRLTVHALKEFFGIKPVAS